jgi:biopolymer transport protein ExbB/TolQ
MGMKLLIAFQHGGVMMYPILVLGLFMAGISLERFFTLYFRAYLNKETFYKNLTGNLLKGDFEGMIQLCDQNSAPMSRVIKGCLLKLVNRASDAEIQAALDEGAMIEVPQLEKRIGFLAVIGNVSTLVGLLGTITGLITSFASIANADAATKAAELTRGISEAMNCTAFGLVVAVPAVLFYSILQSRCQRLIDDLNEVSIKTLNFILANRSKFGTQAKAA